MSTSPAPTAVVIPCAAEKLTGWHPARDLYASANFRNTLTAAEALATAEGGRVLILSALYGLVELTDRLHSYDVKIGEGHPAEITAAELADQLADHGLVGADLYCLLPADYLAKIDAAARTVATYAFDLYEGDAGIGYQRSTVKTVRQTHALAA